MDHAVLETDRHRYAVVSWLADGGMGAIYRGHRLDAKPGGVEEEVVLKQLLPEHTADPKLIEMFLREARLSASLSHKNIVKTLDLVNAGDDYFIVMEYVRGGDLRALLRRAKRRHASLSVESCLFIVSEILAALTYAHDKRGRDGTPLGLIHRDVSPSNVLVNDRGQVKLTDFGIAKAPTQGSIVFKVKGKVGYMAPEQARGEPVDRRTDLFAVGVVLYELLVGERLFVASALAPAAVVFAQPIRPPSRVRPELGTALDAVVMRALALDPTQRFSTAEEMRQALLGTIPGRAPTERSLAEDLRRACGDDASLWRNLDVAPQSTLDGAASEGTGVISTTDADDEFDAERSSTASRSIQLPARELTSVVRLNSAQNLEGPVTQLEADPFAPTGHVEAPSDFEDDAQTRVNAGPRIAAPKPAPPHMSNPASNPMASPPPRPPASSSSPMVPRATFEPPVQRAAVPPPDSVEQDTRGSFRDAPTRLSSSQPIPVLPAPDSSPHKLASQRAPNLASQRAETIASARDLPTQLAMHASPSKPHSVPIALLDKALRGRSTTRLIFTIFGLLVLVALGVTLGVILSGERPPAP